MATVYQRNYRLYLALYTMTEEEQDSGKFEVYEAWYKMFKDRQQGHGSIMLESVEATLPI